MKKAEVCKPCEDVYEAMEALESDIRAAAIGADYMDFIRKHLNGENVTEEASNGYFSILESKYGLNIQDQTIVEYVKDYLAEQGNTAA